VREAEQKIQIYCPRIILTLPIGFLAFASFMAKPGERAAWMMRYATW
jgi:hypothetical protein